MTGVSHTELLALAEELLKHLRDRGARLVTAESCTGGQISGFLTAIPGSSDVLDRGFVTYSNEAKVEMLGVPAELIAEHGAVSAPVAEAMARGALAHANASVALSVTGVAGPGQSERKPAGLVFIGHAFHRSDGRVEIEVAENRFRGDRETVRLLSVKTALSMAMTA